MGFTEWGYVDASDSGVIDAKGRPVSNEVVLPSYVREQLEWLPRVLDDMGRKEKSVLERVA